MSMLSDTTKLKKAFPSWLLPAFGYLVSAVSLIWVLRTTPLRESADHLRHLSWIWVALALIFEVAANFSHAWRWRILLSPAEPVPLWRCVQSVLIGLFANEVLPAKAGEVIRAYLLSHWTKGPLTAQCRLRLDRGHYRRHVAGDHLRAGHRGCTQSAALAVAGSLGARHRGCRAFAGVSLPALPTNSIPTRWSPATSGRPSFCTSLTSCTSWVKVARWLPASGVSFLYMVFQTLSIWALLHADQYDFDIRQAGLIVIVFRIFTLVPNAPGNIGALQFATYLGVKLAGGDEGSAFGEVNFVFLTLARLLQGGIAILLTGINLTEIHRHAQVAHESRMRARWGGL